MNLAVQADTNGVAGLIGRSFACYRMGDYQSCANSLVQATLKAPNDARLRFKCAQVLNKAQRFDEAVSALDALKRFTPNDPKIFAGMAIIRKSQKQFRYYSNCKPPPLFRLFFSEAVKQATIAIDMDNKLTSAMVVRAIASLNLGNLSDAIKDTERVLGVFLLIAISVTNNCIRVG
jgi:tetratricopeptide (TPR) repeat protein